ncbi:hypothetical protein F3J14_23185 [Burkholderia sp. Tr-862]|nr:hypothetical protein [Burkholderia sp. Tr-862]
MKRRAGRPDRTGRDCGAGPDGAKAGAAIRAAPGRRSGERYGRYRMGANRRATCMAMRRHAGECRYSFASTS